MSQNKKIIRYSEITMNFFDNFKATDIDKRN